MLRQLGLFPSIVQTHTLQQHIDLSLSCRGVSEFTYAAFVECLCRIAFVFLDGYGNTTQQKASSLCKGCWLIALLAARCQRCGPSIGLPSALCSLHPRTLWATRKKFNLEGTPLEELVLWRAMNACQSDYQS